VAYTLAYSMEPSAIEPPARLWARPDFQSLAFGRQGEVLAAKVRLGVMALVAMIPLESVLLRPPDPEARIGLGAAVAVFALGALVLRVAQRPAPPAWLGLFTCLLDVTTVSAINAVFVLAGNPLAATNSRVVFGCYFVALAMVGLRQDRRWCLVAALAAMAEYGAIVLWAAGRYDLGGPAFARSGYGTFNWDNQAGRLVLLAAAGAIGTVIVVQGRGYWGAVIRYLDAFPLSVLITGPDGRSQYANRAARELLGRPLPAGTDMAELAAQSFLAGTGRPYPPERGAIARALAGEPTASDDLEIQRPDARIAVAVWGTPILDARGRVTNAIAVFHDETQRRRAEEELRRLAAAVAASEERYRALFEQSLGLLCTHALDGTLLTVNDAAAAALGLSPDRMVGHNLGEFLAPTVRGQLRDYLAAIAARGDMNGTMVLLHDAGGERVWQYRNQLVRVPGQDPYVVGHALDVTERTRLERVLREQALTDPLTGLANRALFEDRLRRALERARREAAVHGEMPPLSLVYLDLDGFKEVNDRCGHAAGDAVLREVGSRLREGVRTLDTVARLGGDEFALILPDIGSAANARRLVEKLLERLRSPFLHDGTALEVSASLGVGMLLGDGDSAEILTARADRAMYAAKAAGGNGYRFSGEGGDAGDTGERGAGEGGPGEGAAW
jgi:diguanylate cyclase (GGDEF)-like protein/PAS domain S-box-containing protein